MADQCVRGLFTGSLEEELRLGIEEVLPVIWDGRYGFTEISKVGIGDKVDDLSTSVDHVAQAMLVERFRRTLSGFQFLCEEEAPGIEAWDGHRPYLTIDGLDGTLPFKAGNLHAVSAMVAAVINGEPIAACIGDVTTRDTYSYGPGSVGVTHASGKHRILLPSTLQELEPLGQKPNRAHLRRKLKDHKSVTQDFAGGFHGHEITYESFGVAFPRLWKREFRINVLWHGTKESPEDMTPVIGISRKLGYVFLKSTDDGKAFVLYEPTLPTTTHLRGYDTIVIHNEDLSLVEPWLRH